MVSTLVSHTRGTGFDSRHLQILLTSFLLCAKFCPKQISPARTIKATSILLLCAKFCSKWIGIMFKNLSISLHDEMVVWWLARWSHIWKVLGSIPGICRFFQLHSYYVPSFVQNKNPLHVQLRLRQHSYYVLSFVQNELGLCFKIWASLYMMRW